MPWIDIVGDDRCGGGYKPSASPVQVQQAKYADWLGAMGASTESVFGLDAVGVAGLGFGWVGSGSICFRVVGSTVCGFTSAMMDSSKMA